MYKVGIIGGGACGLLVANELKKNLGDSICIDIIDKNSKVGKKILMSGNGRCNFSNLNVNPLAYNNPDFVKPILQTFPTQVLTKWFDNLGVMSYVDSEGRIYPLSDSANSCLDMLVMPLSYYNVKVLTDILIDKIEYRYQKYHVCGKDFDEKYDALVITVGSNAGDKYKRNPIMEALVGLGYKYTKMAPALGPILVNDDIKSLKGIRVAAKATLFIDDSQYESEGEILFKEDSLSGIAIFELSSYLARFKVLDKEMKVCKIKLDLLPQQDVKELHNTLLLRKQRFENYSIEYLLRGIFSKMLAYKIYQRAAIRLGSRLCGSLTDEEIESLITAIKEFTCVVNTQKNCDIYQVVSGGIELSQVERRTLESRKHPNLYFGGEVLDIDGICGGYNLHFAFACGYQIAHSIIAKEREK